MSGKWVYDDDQSLYFVADQDHDELEEHSFVSDLETWPLDTVQNTLHHDTSLSDEQRTNLPATSPVVLDADLVVATNEHFVNEVLTTSNRQESSKSISTTNVSIMRQIGPFGPRKRTIHEILHPSEDFGSNTHVHSTLKRTNFNSIDRTFTSRSTTANSTMGFNTSLPRSRFDAYIHALRQLIRCANERSNLGGNLKRAITAEGVLWVVREAWPAAEGYWNLTATFRGFLSAELWRNFPCERTYRQLPPEYRPTRVQLMIPHSPMIDWMPWPDIRDLAIRYQDVIDTDELFRTAILNVVAHRRNVKRLTSSLATSSSNQDSKSFRVWDLVCLEKSNGTNPLADPGLCRRPSLHSPSARALVRAFDLEYDQFSTQKLDNSFFVAFPNLHCETAFSGWQVEEFPNMDHEDVGYPIAMSSSAVKRLKSRIETLIGAPIQV